MGLIIYKTMKSECFVKVLRLHVSVGMLGEGSWPPVVDFYDFLKVIDEQEPGSAQQHAPVEEEDKEDEEEVDVEDDEAAEEATESSFSSSSPDSTLTHSEL